jgi:hypothetical protein
MPVPNNAIRKAIRNPIRAINWVRNNFPETMEPTLSGMFGWHPYDHEWDLLVILDACRYDLASESEVTNEFGEVSRIWSLGANSPQWIQRTFDAATDDQLSSTAYISANPFTDDAPGDKLAVVDNVQEYAFDSERGTVPPRAVTDRSIDIIRNNHFDQSIVHYIQPHLPPVNNSGEYSDFITPPEEEEKRDTNPWEDVEDGSRDGDRVRRAYEKNLSPVAEEVRLLLNNVDAETVVITSDHGNYLGERGRWGHHYFHGMHPAVRAVPYWETTAINNQTHFPCEYSQDSISSTRLERLEALGYR